MASVDRLQALESELATLKRQRKEEKRAAKVQSQWVNAKKRMPDQDALRVLAWVGDGIERCWAKDGLFYAYDGTFFLTAKDRS